MGFFKIALGAAVGFILGITMSNSVTAIVRLESFNVIHHPFGPVTKVLVAIGPHPLTWMCLIIGAGLGFVSMIRDREVDEQLKAIRDSRKE